MKGSREAKRKRQYRARTRRREREIVLRFRNYLRRTRPEAVYVGVFGTSVLMFEAMRISQWRMVRELKKTIYEYDFKWLAPHPGAASGLTQNNLPQGEIASAMPPSAASEDVQ